MIKAFIFDFDGLIIDTETSCYLSWKTIYQRYAVDLPLSEWIKCVGSSNDRFDPIQFLKSKTIKNLPETLEGEQYQIHYQTSQSYPVLPGVLTYLNFARENDIKLAVASSSPASWVYAHLKQKELLPYFDEIVTSDDVVHVKPAPDLFLKVKEKLNINDYEGIVFEDSEHGIDAATQANLFTVAIPNQITALSDFRKATLVLTKMDQFSPESLINNLQNNHSIN